MGAALSMMGVGFPALESVLAEQFRKKEQAVIDENVSVARAGYDYATAELQALRLAAAHDREHATPCSAATPPWPWAARPQASSSTAPIP